MIKRTRPYRIQRIVEQGKSKLVSTFNEKSIWELLKEYINKFPMGNVISRMDLISSIYYKYSSLQRYNTVDSYIYNLRTVGVLETIKPGKYKKLRNIPIKLTTSQLSRVAKKNSWESWFMTIDYI